MVDLAIQRVMDATRRLHMVEPDRVKELARLLEDAADAAEKAHELREHGSLLTRLLLVSGPSES